MEWLYRGKGVSSPGEVQEKAPPMERLYPSYEAFMHHPRITYTKFNAHQDASFSSLTVKMNKMNDGPVINQSIHNHMHLNFLLVVFIK